MARSIPTLTCPYCKTTFYGVVVKTHGAMTCSACGKTVRV